MQQDEMYPARGELTVVNFGKLSEEEKECKSLKVLLWQPYTPVMFQSSRSLVRSELLNWTGHSLSRNTGALFRFARLVLLISAFSVPLASLRAELGFVITGDELAGYEATVHGLLPFRFTS